MNGYEKLIELLEKDNLSSEDENYINELCKEDEEAENICNVYKNLKSSSIKYNRITTEQLADYILYLNGQEPQDKNIISLIPEIEQQLRTSKELKNEFEFLNSEYSETEQFIQNTITKNPEKENNNFFISANLSGIRKYSLYSVTAAAALYLILLFSINISTPEYRKNIVLQENNDGSYTRGRISESFQQSLMYINNSNYTKAIELLNKDIAENPEGKTIFYSHYVLGMLHLQKSRSNFLGLFKSYNEADLRKGIAELKLAVDKNTNDQFKNINLNAYFFIGNAFLALDDIATAKSYFELVKKEKGGYMKNAENLLDSFNGER